MFHSVIDFLRYGYCVVCIALFFFVMHITYQKTYDIFARIYTMRKKKALLPSIGNRAGKRRCRSVQLLLYEFRLTVQYVGVDPRGWTG